MISSGDSEFRTDVILEKVNGVRPHMLHFCESEMSVVRPNPVTPRR